MSRLRFVSILTVFMFLFACKDKTALEKANTNAVNNIYIDPSLANEIQPVLKDWLDFYEISLSHFTPIDTTAIDWTDLKKNTFIYFKKFTPEDEKFMPGLRSYSPDRNRFVDLIEGTKDLADDMIVSTQKWELESPHVEQHIYLYNRIDSTSMLLAIKRKVNLIDNSYWIDNDRFVLSGVDRRQQQSMYYFDLYSIHEKVVMTFCLPDSTISEKDSYLIDILLPKRKHHQ